MPASASVRTSGKGTRGRLLKFITCPHCWHRFETCEIVWVAKHEDLRGDPVLGSDEFLRFLPTRFNVTGEALDARGLACQSLACPRCHLIIPRVFLRYEPLIFSLIGVPYSGKSYFLTAMTWELGRILPTEFGLVFSDVDPTINETLNEYQKMLFLQERRDHAVGIIKTQLDSSAHYDSTNLEGQSVLLPRPFLFSMRPLKEHFNPSQVEELTRVLCLYDNAGEHFLPRMDTPVAPGTQHVACSKVLMFIYDPIQDPRIREACRDLSKDPQLGRYAHTQLQSTILTEAAVRVRLHANMPAHSKLDQPLIVLVSKSDIWEGLIDEDLASDPYVRTEDSPDGLARIDLRRVKRVSRKVRHFLRDLAPEFVAAAEDCCKEVVYMPVSALGCSPSAQRSSGPGKDNDMLVIRPRDIKPRWATVPVVYAFTVWATGLVRKMN